VQAGDPGESESFVNSVLDLTTLFALFCTGLISSNNIAVEFEAGCFTDMESDPIFKNEKYSIELLYSFQALRHEVFVRSYFRSWS